MFCPLKTCVRLIQRNAFSIPASMLFEEIEGVIVLKAYIVRLKTGDTRLSEEAVTVEIQHRSG